MGGMAMRALMMVCCLGFALLFLMMPLVGWPVGIAIVAIGAVGMFLFHQRFMRHGHWKENSMTRRAIAAITILGVSTVALAVALEVVLATDDDSSGGDAHVTGNGYAGMMGAMAGMDSDAMLERMREVLGEAGYAAMLQHMEDHRDGTAGFMAPGIDGMMHQMMDGMMSMMPADGAGHMFPNDEMPMPGIPGR